MEKIVNKDLVFVEHTAVEKIVNKDLVLLEHRAIENNRKQRL